MSRRQAKRSERATRCQYRYELESDTGKIRYTKASCPLPAEWSSCMPFVGTPTCEVHKCRCAKPLATTSPAEPPAKGES